MKVFINYSLKELYHAQFVIWYMSCVLPYLNGLFKWLDNLAVVVSLSSLGSCVLISCVSDIPAACDLLKHHKTPHWAPTENSCKYSIPITGNVYNPVWLFLCEKSACYRNLPEINVLACKDDMERPTASCYDGIKCFFVHRFLYIDIHNIYKNIRIYLYIISAKAGVLKYFFL